MTTNTMVAIQSYTVSGSTTNQIQFSSIPNTYTDLMLVLSGTTTTNNYSSIYYNTDNAGGNYSWTYLLGTGSSSVSGKATNQNTLNSSDYEMTSYQSSHIMHIMNYANTTTYKTALFRYNVVGDGVGSYASLWRSISAINQITLVRGSGYYNAGYTATLYGIANADIGAYATGGIITQDSTYYYHAFGSSGTFTPSRALTADILVVAGGGGGGASDRSGGAGGAGGLVLLSAQSLASGTGYSCTVGAGGAAASGVAVGSQGAGSQFGALTAAVGGGYGGGTNSGGSGMNGGNGGSGGGAAHGGISGGTGSQGSNGGTPNNTGGNQNFGGGGGGYSVAGGNATSTTAGAGGNGTNAYASWLSGLGDNGYLAGGGSGAANYSSAVQASGGLGGGGKGAATNSTTILNSSTAGMSNTGGGGGAGTGNSSGNAPASAGGSGLIIVRYAK